MRTLVVPASHSWCDNVWIKQGISRQLIFFFSFFRWIFKNWYFIIVCASNYGWFLSNFVCVANVRITYGSSWSVSDLRINLISKLVCYSYGSTWSVRVTIFKIWCFLNLVSIFLKLLIFLFGHFLFGLVRWTKMSGCMKNEVWVFDVIFFL